MRTIPLDPVFDNPAFKKLKPAQKFFVIQAVYLLCREDKQGEPIPNSVRQYVQCSNSTYDRCGGIFKEVLHSVMPQIADIKLKYYNRIKNAHKASLQKTVSQRNIQRENVVFSDNTDSHVEISPIQVPREKWNKGKVDHVAIKKAQESKEANTDEVWFTDN